MSEKNHRRTAKRFRSSDDREGCGSVTLLSPDAIREARDFALRLEREAHKGPGDKRGAALRRVAEDIGVSFATLSRLVYSADQMTGLMGDAYRRLLIAYLALEGEVELAVDRKRHVRLRLDARERRELARDESEVAGPSEVRAP